MQIIMEEQFNNGTVPPVLPPSQPVTEGAKLPDYDYDEKNRKFTQTLSFKRL